MKLSVKTLKGQTHIFELEPSDTIEDLKKKIKDQKEIDIDLQKIVYKGKELANTDAVNALGIKETEYMVLMIFTKKPQRKHKQQAKQTKQQVKTITPASKQKYAKKQEILNQFSQNQTQIRLLMRMGFDRQKCIRALEAAHNRTSLAIKYLHNGISSKLTKSFQEKKKSPQHTQKMLRNLFSSPPFQQIKQILRKDPNAITNVLEQMMVSWPRIYHLIEQNSQIVQKILNEQFGFHGKQVEDSGFRSKQMSLQLADNEISAIKRLMALGFSKIDAAQAYFACDKNQEQAANLLFDRSADGDFDKQSSSGNKEGFDKGGNNDNLFK